MKPEDETTLLARLDERVKAMQADLAKLVTKAEFFPVKAIAFGLAALVFTTTLTFVLSRVFGHS